LPASADRPVDTIELLEHVGECLTLVRRLVLRLCDSDATRGMPTHVTPSCPKARWYRRAGVGQGMARDMRPTGEIVSGTRRPSPVNGQWFRVARRTSRAPRPLELVSTCLEATLGVRRVQ
jgi:hypothetical protein